MLQTMANLRHLSTRNRVIQIRQNSCLRFKMLSLPILTLILPMRGKQSVWISRIHHLRSHFRTSIRTIIKNRGSGVSATTGARARRTCLEADWVPGKASILVLNQVVPTIMEQLVTVTPLSRWDWTTNSPWREPFSTTHLIQMERGKIRPATEYQRVLICRPITVWKTDQVEGRMASLNKKLRGVREAQ